MNPASQSRTEIDALTSQWLSAERRQDLGAMLDMVTDDAVFLLPNGQPVVGKGEIESLFRSFFASFSSQHEAVTKEVQVFDAWAYAWGVETTVLTPRGGGASIRLRGFGLSVLRRGQDGQWRFARGINNLAPEPPRPAAATS